MKTKTSFFRLGLFAVTALFLSQVFAESAYAQPGTPVVTDAHNNVILGQGDHDVDSKAGTEVKIECDNQVTADWQYRTFDHATQTWSPWISLSNTPLSLINLQQGEKLEIKHHNSTLWRITGK